MKRKYLSSVEPEYRASVATVKPSKFNASSENERNEDEHVTGRSRSRDEHRAYKVTHAHALTHTHGTIMLENHVVMI